MQISNIAMLAIAAVAVAAVVAFASKKPRKAHGYKAKRPLTNNEQAMYWRLVTALPEHAVLAQVNMSSFLRTESQSARGTISQKSVDFLICDKSFNVIAAIEIDDKSHDRTERRRADETKTAAIEAAGIRLIRWRATPLPNTEEIVKNVIGAGHEKREISGRVSSPKQPQERQPNSNVHGLAKRDGDELQERPPRHG